MHVAVADDGAGDTLVEQARVQEQLVEFRGAFRVAAVDVNEMPMGRGMCGMVSGTPNIACRFSAKKPAYLKIDSSRRLTLTAPINASFAVRLPRFDAISSEKNQSANDIPTSRKTYIGSPQA